MGATVSELTVIDIIVQPGMCVTKGQKLAELESDKSVFEFESPCDGMVREILGRAGDIMSSGTPFLRMETSDESLKHLQTAGDVSAASVPAKASASVAAPISLSQVPPTPKPTAIQSPKPVGGSGLMWTPRAIKLAQDSGFDHTTITDIKATGPGGRVSGDDVEAWIASHPAVSGSATRTTGAFVRPLDETVCIAGVGYAFPLGVRSNIDILKEFPDMTEDEVIKLTGIRERRYAAEGETATSLAVTAVRRALAQAKVDVAEIDGVILATLIPDQPVPAMASALARQLGIPRALAFDLNAACAGWLYALEVGRAFIRGGTAKKLIVVTAELLSRITNPKDHATAFLFGDGAGAAILTDSEGGHRLWPMALAGDADQFEAIQRLGGGALRPMPKKSGDDDHDFFLQMNGAAVFKHAVIAFADQIESTIKRHGLKSEDIAWIVPHQANERILRAVSKRVGIPYEKFVVTIGKYGNTSAASISMALGWAAEEEIFTDGDRIIFCSVGAGLTFASGLLVW